MRMKAIVYTEHGPADVLKLTDVEVPAPAEQEVLLSVRAAALNPLDWHFMRGEPFVLRLMGRAKQRIPGADVAGQVEKIGAQVTQFHPGDEVFGAVRGACAQYVCGKESSLVPKPARLTYEEAATIPVAGCTALQALRDHGQLQSGQRVLINGAAGGVGTFAVQIAKALGADVTAVCGTRNVELLRSIGADNVIDYTAGDFTRNGRQYDLILQVAGNRSVRELRRALAPQGTLIMVGGGTGREESGSGDMLGVLAPLIRSLFSRFTRQRVRLILAKIRRNDLLAITELIEAGQLTPVVDRAYPLADTAAAIRYLEAGHARGKVVVVP